MSTAGRVPASSLPSRSRSPGDRPSFFTLNRALVLGSRLPASFLTRHEKYVLAYANVCYGISDIPSSPVDRVILESTVRSSRVVSDG